jgi:hypothetical protein
MSRGADAATAATKTTDCDAAPHVEPTEQVAGRVLWTAMLSRPVAAVSVVSTSWAGPGRAAPVADRSGAVRE